MHIKNTRSLNIHLKWHGVKSNFETWVEIEWELLFRNMYVYHNFLLTWTHDTNYSQNHKLYHKNILALVPILMVLSVCIFVTTMQLWDMHGCDPLPHLFSRNNYILHKKRSKYELIDWSKK